MPGVHVIEVALGGVRQESIRGGGRAGGSQTHDRLVISRSRGKARIRLKAEAGETYDIDYYIEGRRVRFFIPQLVTFQNYEPHQNSSRD